MYRRFHAQLAALIALPLLAGGCTQMTRHSNMMVFGTNTVLGVRVGSSAANVGSVDIGYTRQEAVVMPLVANVASPGDPSLLVPCAMAQPTPPPGGGGGVPAVMPPPPPNPAAIARVNPCLLVAVNAAEGARDSYSVLASFGASFGGSSSSGEAKAGLAQYFATGLAAQLLALNGGAAVVATGDAANNAANNVPMTLSGITPTAAEVAAAAPAVSAMQAQRSALSAKVKATAAANLAAQFTTFEGAISGPTKNIMASCSTPDACAALVDGGYFNSNYTADASVFAAAVSAWP